MPHYRVVVDGEEVWSGEGDNAKSIPQQWWDRPADSGEGEPDPPAHFLYCDDELIGVQISQAEEDRIEAEIAALSDDEYLARFGRRR